MKQKILLLFTIFLLFATVVFASGEDDRTIAINVENGERTIVDEDVTAFLNTNIEENIINYNISPYAIWGNDDRGRDYLSCVCRLEATNPYDDTKIITTATMIGPNVAITSAHSVYQDALGGQFYDIEVIPGYDGGSRPYASTGIKIMYLAQAWIDKNGKAEEDNLDEYYDSFNYDWAVLVLNEDIGYSSGWLSFDKYDNYLDLFNMEVKLIGYPYYLKGMNLYNNYLYQYSAIGKIDTAFSRRIEYIIDTSGGQSGAPLINTSTNKVVGVHGGTTKGELSNRGIRINEQVYNAILTGLNQ